MIELIDTKLINDCYLYCLKKVKNQEYAEEISQNALLEIVKCVENKKIQNFYAYFWSVVDKQIALFFYKKNKEAKLINKYCGMVDNEYFFIDEQEADDIRKALLFISQIYREVLIRYYLKKQSIQEIATSLNLSYTAVKKRLFDAKEKTRKEIKTMEKKIAYDLPIIYFIGGGDIKYYKKINKQLIKSIIYVCSKESKSLNEIAKILQVNPLLIKDEIDELVSEQFLIQKNNKYESNIIFHKFNESIKLENELYQYKLELSDKFNELLDNKKNDIMPLFVTLNYNYKELKWFLLSYISCLFTYKCKELLALKYHYQTTWKGYTYVGFVEESEDEKITRTFKTTNWGNMHYNFITSNNQKVRIEDKYNEAPFTLNRCDCISEYNIDIIYRNIKNQEMIISEKDKFEYAKLIQNGIIKDGKLTIPYCTYKNFYEKFYSYIEKELDSLVSYYFDIIEKIINKHYLADLKKHLISDYYDVDMELAFQPVNVVMYEAIKNNWVHKLQDYSDCKYGIMIIVD